MGKMPYFLVFLLLICCCSAVLGVTGSSNPSWAWDAMNGYKKQAVQSQCTHTRYPNLCFQTLMEDYRDHPVDMISALINKTMSEIKLSNSLMFKSSTSQQQIKEAQSAQQSFRTADYCEELMRMSLKLLDKSLLALEDSPTKNKHDIQTWLSGAITFQQACKDSADTVALSSSDLMATEHLSNKMDDLSKLASNSLALVNRITSTKSRHLAGQNEGFPTWVSAKNRKLLQSNGMIKADAVVAKDGTGNYKTISEAIQAARSGKRFVIFVKSGVYTEKIKTNKDGITLIGEGKYSTIIAGDDSVAGGSSMPDTATFTITGDGFMAKEIGFQNTAGPRGEQALALYVASDRSVFYHCSIVGYQDTLFALALRQFYRECDIYGTIDFIFGNAAAVIQNSNLVLRRPQSGHYNVILANGRTDPGQNTGFSIQNCKITAGSEFSPVKHEVPSYLGRPWKEYSRSVVMQTYVDDAIVPGGWVEWPGEGSYRKTLYYAEYSNTGPGAGTSRRVAWPGFRVIGAQEAAKFTVNNLIAGSSWLPSTGVSFISGLI